MSWCGSMLLVLRGKDEEQTVGFKLRCTREKDHSGLHTDADQEWYSADRVIEQGVDEEEAFDDGVLSTWGDDGGQRGR